MDTSRVIPKFGLLLCFAISCFTLYSSCSGKEPFKAVKPAQPAPREEPKPKEEGPKEQEYNFTQKKKEPVEENPKTPCSPEDTQCNGKQPPNTPPPVNPFP